MMIDRKFIKAPIEDLADFYTRWPSLRGLVDEVISCPTLNEEEREVVLWLKLLADRVGPEDIAPHNLDPNEA